MNLQQQHNEIFTHLCSFTIDEDLLNYCLKKNIISLEDYEVEPSVPFTCFMGAEYVAMLWGYDDEMKNSRVTVASLEELWRMRGVYYFALESSLEDHEFVLWISNEYIVLYNSYGGTSKFFVCQFKRSEWISMFIKMESLSVDQQLSLYPKLWGFTNQMVKEALGSGPDKFIINSLTYIKIL